ncbi:unnamed protein product, partial [Adineta ricciae]
LSASASYKQTSNMEMSLRKAEQELEKTERKYHDATKDVEIARQACDAEMCRCCDQMQTMELDRITEMEKFIQTYSNAIKTLTDTMNQVTQDLYAIRITPVSDVVLEAKQNVQTAEIEILTYDIYAQNDHNAMSQERRILSLMHWIQMLKQDIEIQKRSKNGVVVRANRDYSASASNDDDDDGTMHRQKKSEKKKGEGIENLQGFCKQNQNFSTSVNPSEICINRESVRLLQCLYEGSLYQMEKVYNHIKSLPEPQYEYSQCFAKSYTDKNIPTTLLRIPFQPSNQNPPSAPSSTSYLARSSPVVGTPVMPHQHGFPPPPPYSGQGGTPIGWAIDNLPHEHPAPDNRSMAPGPPPYPVLPSSMTSSTDSLRHPPQLPVKYVKVLHSYDAEHDDELTIRPGDLIILLERRPDQWCRGNLDGNIGLFPGNFVQEL